MPRIEGDLKPCENGYHVCTLEQLPAWIGPAIFETEVRGEKVEAGDKIVVREARLKKRVKWDDKLARLFAADCAEHVLPIYEKQYPDDKRPRQAIEAARRYARGEIDAAAWDAAGAAARDAAWDAAGAAARDAAWDAAWDAARDEERGWQIRRLRRYLTGKVR
jgi:L-alanine-DL-glutamate epimerase-like enolase superfamily enzyme